MSTQLRWHSFLQKIGSAADALLAEGHAGCVDLGTSAEGTVAMSNAWQGVRAEIFALVEKVESTWSEKVAQALGAEGLSSAEQVQQEELGRALRRQLLHQCEREEIETFGEVAQHLLNRARATLAREFRCTHCGALLTVPERIFRSVYVNCEYCQAVNTFEPGSQGRQIEHFCGHHLSQLAAVGAWEEMKAAEQRRRDTRGEDPAVNRDIVASAERYWRVYYETRATLVPDFLPDVERDVEAKVKGVEAGLPRR